MVSVIDYCGYLTVLAVIDSAVLICAEYPMVPEHGESNTVVQDSASHASSVHSYYSSQPVNSFDFSFSVCN